MAKTKGQKVAIVDGLTDKIGKSKSMVFVNFDKLTVEENEVLRNDLRAEDSEYYTAKKTLLNVSLKNNDLDAVDFSEHKHQAAVVFGYSDEVAPAKIIAKFAKEHEGKMSFVGGILERKFIDGSAVAELAKLPSKQELYARIVGSINAPVSGFVNVLAGNIRGLVTVLKAIEEKKV